MDGMDWRYGIQIHGHACNDQDVGTQLGTQGKPSISYQEAEFDDQVIRSVQRDVDMEGASDEIGSDLALEVLLPTASKVYAQRALGSQFTYIH